ncbi:MAG: S-methyl-5-thioribose-1-phosphate isomerase [Gemmatimonadales bacterium]
MRVGERSYRSIQVGPDGRSVEIVDQTCLPAEFVLTRLGTLDDVVRAIRTMQVRGAPLIGVAAAYGVALALQQDPSDAALEAACWALLASRPTAVNIRTALDRMRAALREIPLGERAEAAYRVAGKLAEEDVAINERIGLHGERILRGLAASKPEPLQVLTHCNAGWLATVDWGTALAPVYRAHEAGLPVHVWVSETRPRNQGYLTAWELTQQGVPHTVIVDSAAGLLLTRGQVDVVLVGADRVTRRGDVANKIGTYLKALAAREAGVPFYVAVPSPTIDWSLEDGARIPIEERAAAEVIEAEGMPVHNPGFDITPGRLVTGLITERGLATPDGLRALFPENESSVHFLIF